MRCLFHPVLRFSIRVGHPETSRPVAEQMKQMYSKLTKEQLGAQSRLSLASMITDPKNGRTCGSCATRRASSLGCGR